MKLKPMADNVLLKANEEKEMTASGIILATTNKEKPAIYEVVSVGPGTKDVTMTVQPGDRVVVGKFTGNDVPACGFSIGFERIILLLMESGFKVPSQPGKVAYLIEKGISSQELCKVIAQAQEERKEGLQVLVVRMTKNKKFQKEQLTKEGYTEFKEFYKNPLK